MARVADASPPDTSVAFALGYRAGLLASGSSGGNRVVAGGHPTEFGVRVGPREDVRHDVFTDRYA